MSSDGFSSKTIFGRGEFSGGAVILLRKLEDAARARAGLTGSGRTLAGLAILLDRSSVEGLSDGRSRSKEGLLVRLEKARALAGLTVVVGLKAVGLNLSGAFDLTGRSVNTGEYSSSSFLLGLKAFRATRS